MGKYARTIMRPVQKIVVYVNLVGYRNRIIMTIRKHSLMSEMTKEMLRPVLAKIQ